MKVGSRLAPLLSILLCVPLGWSAVQEWRRHQDLEAIRSVRLAASAHDADGADLVYFYSPACQLCRRATPLVVRAAQRHPSLRVAYFNVAAGDFYEIRDRLNQRFAVPEKRAGEIPALFSRRRGLVGSAAILAHLTEEVHASLVRKRAPPHAAPMSDTRDRARSRLQPWPVAAAAVADSINPCAISTALFLVSYLAWAGRSRRQLALTGVLYSLGAFGCYGLSGLGLLRGLYGLSGLHSASLALNMVAGIGTLALGFLNLRQYLLLRRGLLRPAELGLPQAARQATHAAIRRIETRPALWGVAAFATGCVVSALELPCTGQIYLPTIVYLAGFPEERATALRFLLLYNLIFVAPLAALFAGALTARSTRRIQDLVRRHLPATRLINAACFFTMAGFFLLNLAR